MRVWGRVCVRVGFHRRVAAISGGLGDANELGQRSRLAPAIDEFGVLRVGDVPGVDEHLCHGLCVESIVGAHEAIAKAGQRAEVWGVGQLNRRENASGGGRNRVIVFEIHNDVLRGRVVDGRLQRFHCFREV
jgi:hypothetical protein